MLVGKFVMNDFYREEILVLGDERSMTLRSISKEQMKKLGWIGNSDHGFNFWFPIAVFLVHLLLIYFSGSGLVSYYHPSIIFSIKMLHVFYICFHSELAFSSSGTPGLDPVPSLEALETTVDSIRNPYCILLAGVRVLKYLSLLGDSEGPLLWHNKGIYEKHTDCLSLCGLGFRFRHNSVHGVAMILLLQQFFSALV
ncbi:hypothetical protein Tco_1394997 [Tanacetum coccineum]